MRISQLTGIEQFFLTQLSRADESALQSAIRLSTGKRVNEPADDPAAFIKITAFEDRLEAVKSAKTQVEAAAAVGSETQLALDEMRSQLDFIRSSLLFDEGGLLTAEERTVEQLSIDEAIEAIGDLSRAETNGRRYLDGSVNYHVSGKNSAQVGDFEVYAANETTYDGNVATAATQAQRTYNGSGTATITDSATFTLTGKRGSATITVTADETLTDAVARINDQSHNTGVTAVENGNDIDFTAIDFGASATMNFSVASGIFNTSGTSQGTDAVATINGQVISANNIDGNRVTYTNNGTHVVFELQAGFSGNLDTITVADNEVAKFTLSTNLSDRTSFSLPPLVPELLGGLSGTLTDLISGGSLSGLGTNTSQAIRVVDEALAQLSLADGRTAAFADVAVDSASSFLDGLTASLEETLESMNGVNEDEESLVLARNQSLGANTLAAISILQQQQASVLTLVQAAALY